MHSLRRIMNSTCLILMIIISGFVFVGYRLIIDMRNGNMGHTNTEHHRGTKSDPEQMDPITVNIGEYTQNNKPLRIILTIATNIDPQRTYLFLSSYRRWHPVQDQTSNKIYQLFMFTQFSQEKYMKELQRMADYFEITLVDMEPIESALDEKYYDILKINMKWIKINKRRFFVLFHWLQQFENTADIDTIFLSDANDVKFQGNIFSLYDSTMSANGMSLSYDDDIFWFFMENPDVMMDGEKWNRRYIKYCFGNESIPFYHDLHVSCSGTSLGTYGSMYYYLEIMNEILIKQCPLFYDCCRKPGDQALHNIILHKELLLEKDKNIKIIQIPNDSGWILQITTMINHPTWSKKVPELAEKSMVVHQWKWARSVKEKYQREYNYQAFCNEQQWNDCTINKG